MKRDKKPLVAGYDYSTREKREKTVGELFSRAKNARSMVEESWRECNEYYNFIHRASHQTAAYAEEQGMTLPPVVPDAWIAVESQIDPNVPEPEFRGRDDDQDGQKAKDREFAVKYVIENNRLKDKNTRNERRLFKFGDAVWKAFWDPSMRCGIHEGDIRVQDIPLEGYFPDPSVRDGYMQSGQYVDYVYAIHKVEFCRVYQKELKKLEISPESIMNSDYTGGGNLFDLSLAVDDTDDTMQILEHWFKQPEDTTDEKGNKVPAGSIGCCIMAGGKEIKYIPNYWKRTNRQCNLFPFVQYWRIQDETQIWNKSELFPILGMIDAADRKLHMALFNEAMMGNDMIVVEQDALADGEEITNEPGSQIRTKPGRSAGVRRLGGLQSLTDSMAGMEWIQNQMERANRNYETNLGKETTRATTATAVSMLRSDAQDQEDIKKADRNAGFERLYELIDWLVLEFFDDDRVLYLQGKDKDEIQSLEFNADRLATMTQPVKDINGNVVREAWQYWPKVDVTITAGDSVVKSKQATLQALQALTQAQITPDNWKLYAAQLDLLDIPGKQDIVEDWRQRFAMPTTPQMPMAMPIAQGIPGGGMA